MLQSRINEDTGPAIYLCPNKFLVEQTCQQAESFGINYFTAEDEIPDEFIDGKSILITSVHKMFNGKSRFGVGQRGEHVSTILMDDAHACRGTANILTKIYAKTIFGIGKTDFPTLRVVRLIRSY